MLPNNYITKNCIDSSHQGELHQNIICQLHINFDELFTNKGNKIDTNIRQFITLYLQAKVIINLVTSRAHSDRTSFISILL